MVGSRDGLFEGAVPLWSYHWAFYVHRMVGYDLLRSSTADVGVSFELLRDEWEGPWPMAWHFPM